MQDLQKGKVDQDEEQKSEPENIDEKSVISEEAEDDEEQFCMGIPVDGNIFYPYEEKNTTQMRYGGVTYQSDEDDGVE